MHKKTFIKKLQHWGDLSVVFLFMGYGTLNVILCGGE